MSLFNITISLAFNYIQFKEALNWNVDNFILLKWEA